MVADTSPLPQGDDFLALVGRVRDGDETAARDLVGRYERAVLRAVRSRLGQSMRRAMDSMDVVQSVHQSLLLGLRSQRYEMNSPAQLIALAVVMVQRKIARHWRKIKRFPTAGETVSHSHGTPLNGVTSDEPAPAEVAAADDLLAQFLSQLNEFDQTLVRLKLDGNSSVEAAAILGREPAFIRLRWSRLRQMLRKRGYEDQ
ncbi:MAG TPA: sigma-70 family RNA polymerase sigma factor [Pirellulaceae bacterium]|nr:sigma-70 family RNA polymerase sigma factor [Pirellulaceae bacterium]